MSDLIYEDEIIEPTRLGVARSVIKSMDALEEKVGGKLTRDGRRRILRHEVAHFIPLENATNSTKVQGIISETDAGGAQALVGLQPEFHGSIIQAIKSDIAPLGDKKFHQKLGKGDKIQLKEDLSRFIKP